MVMVAEAGDSSHVGVLVLWLGIRVILLVSHIVHVAALTLLAIGIHHRHVVLDMRVALFLPVAFLVAVVVSWPVVVGGPIVANGPVGVLLGQVVIVASAKCCYLLKFVLGQLLRDDSVGLFQLQLSLDSGNLL
jgi:hypothetical protein